MLYWPGFSFRIDRDISEKSLRHLDDLSGAHATGKRFDSHSHRGPPYLNNLRVARNLVANEDWPVKAHRGHPDSNDSPISSTGGDRAAR